LDPLIHVELILMKAFAASDAVDAPFALSAAMQSLRQLFEA
jgi:hypothetical protein